MTKFKKTKVIYENESDKGNEILIDMVINLDQVQCFLPGKHRGTTTAVMNNKIKYALKEDIESLLK